ncbi:MAG: hypothetical protein R2694_08195 [Ilumatobacteraceae bacterium]
MPGNPAASLLVMADHLERYYHEVGDLLPGFQGDDQADVVSALVETERALRTAARLARRAAKLTA